MEFYFDIYWKKGEKESRELVFSATKDEDNADISIRETGSGKFKRIEFYNEDAEIMFAEALAISGDTFKVKFSLKHDLGFSNWDSKNKAWSKI